MGSTSNWSLDFEIGSKSGLESGLESISLFSSWVYHERLNGLNI